MTVKLNRKGYDHARELIEQGRATHDERDDWSEHAPSADDENRYIDEHGYPEYGKWFLGVDDQAPEDTKGRYSFPYGDFTRVHRCGVISAESRAAQYDHLEIEKAAKRLLELIDAK
jgi:hypothetical protein